MPRLRPGAVKYIYTHTHTHTFTHTHITKKAKDNHATPLNHIYIHIHTHMKTHFIYTSIYACVFIVA